MAYTDLEETVLLVKSGDLTIEDGVKILARRANISDDVARFAIQARLDAMGGGTRVQPDLSSQHKIIRATVEHVQPNKFMEVLKKYNLTRAQVAQAIDRSQSRVYELTVSRGAKEAIYDEFVRKVEAYVKLHEGQS